MIRMLLLLQSDPTRCFAPAWSPCQIRIPTGFQANPSLATGYTVTPTKQPGVHPAQQCAAFSEWFSTACSCPPLHSSATVRYLNLLSVFLGAVAVYQAYSTSDRRSAAQRGLPLLKGSRRACSLTRAGTFLVPSSAAWP
ncbi:hypothetical protein NDU88_003057 [Pleurodeles waltl]|uniref:Uncharacterized protein n=1 Tax=Pleurodeles waltl TaxID=8319 RepID=A0AAV7NFQ7_PLEWA|nr:hypothetical protein NDU88_003057 [Pleurodeles waltl]